MVYLILAFLHASPSHAIRLHNAQGYYQEEPPGCRNQPHATGLFNCENVGRVPVIRGRVNFNGKNVCAFLAPTGEPGLLFLEVDNLNDELTYQFKCTRAPSRSGLGWF